MHNLPQSINIGQSLGIQTLGQFLDNKMTPFETYTSVETAKYPLQILWKAFFI